MASTSEVAAQIEQFNPVERQVFDMIGRPNGVSENDISSEIPDVSAEERRAIINKFLSLRLIDLFEKKGGTLIYKLKKAAVTAIPQNSDSEEQIVYNVIEAAGSKGIWSREIHYKSNVAQARLNKVLKSLENKKIIKSVKSVSAGKRKTYMLYDTVPDSSVTGGAWYQDQDFEAEFVDVLNQQCYRYLEHKRDSPKELIGGPMAEKNASYASSNDVWTFINDLGISKVKLSVPDLEMILDTLVYDGKVEKTLTSDHRTLYRAIKPLLDPPGLIQSPCGVCPVRKNCCDVGDVTPITCPYITEWLSI